LDQGERVRLIGIDAPELGRGGAPDQPLAIQAAATLRALAGPPGVRLKIRSGAEPRDRHGRRLAYLFDTEGRHLAEQMLRRGLAYVAAIPPNLRYADCYLLAQSEAREERLGLWRTPALAAHRLPPREGFMRVRGRVARVDTGNGAARAALRIEIAGGLRLYVQERDLAAFASLDLDELQGREVEALGWVYRIQGQPRMRLRHPSALMADPP